MTREELIQAVKVKLEELSPFDDGLMLLQDNDEKPIIDYIDSTLDEAADEMRLALPLKMLRPTELEAAVEIQHGYIGVLKLPADFLRLHTIRNADWKRAVHEAINPNQPDYKLQSNPYTRGKFVKPVAVIENTTQMLLYSVKRDEFSEKKIITRLPAEKCEDGVLAYIILLTAIKVCDIFERVDSSKVLQQELQQKLRVES